MNENEISEDTLIAKIGRNSDLYQGVVNIPVYRASTILFSTLEKLQHSEENMFDTMCYGRLGNPTTWALEDAITQLEGGFKGVVGPSGLSIIATVLMAYAKPGGHILISHNVYSGVRRFCQEVLGNFNVEVEFYDPNLRNNIEKLFRQNTAFIYVESPGSTDLAIADLPSIINVAKIRDIPVIVDNTWATPLYYKPLKYGADISIQSATKYIVGHSDALLGIAVCTEKSWPIVNRMSFYLGICAGPDDAYLALRGLRTLSVRMERYQKSALQIAGWLKTRPEVERVLYPALKDDPGHAIWKRDYTGASGRFAVKLKKASVKAIATMLDQMEHFGMGFSWGGFESIIAPIFPDQQVQDQKQNVLLRISIGLENPQDLIDDLEKGFDRFNSADKNNG